MSRRAVVLVLLEATVVALAFALWGLLSAGSHNVYFPPLTDIFRSFRESWLFTHFGDDVLPSLKRIALGFLLATVVGIGAGVALGSSRVTRTAFSPLLEFVRAIPPPALIPFVLLVFGIGDAAKIFLIALGCVWPIMLGTIDGVAGIDSVTRDTADVYGIKGPRRLYGVTLPAAGPQIAAGMRTSLSLAIILMVISEMVGSTNGIGNFIIEAQRSFAITEMWSGILLLALIGYLLNLAFELCERRVLRWHRMRRADAGGAEVRVRAG
jgi:ABC-type nitrate/sulfonate/bicarbonate transport system permease component